MAKRSLPLAKVYGLLEPGAAVGMEAPLAVFPIYGEISRIPLLEVTNRDDANG
jgi:hypothetical protein